LVSRGSGNDEVLERDKYVAIDPQRLLHVRLTGALRDAHQTAVRLAALGENMHPDFLIPRPSVDPKQRIPVEFDVFKRTKDLAVAQATLKTGWFARGSFNDFQTEYYASVRRLRFERLLLAFRELVSASLNEVIARTSRHLGYTADLEFVNLPTLAEIEAAERHLQAGDLSVTTLLSGLRV
jgi:hypothetical protein